jgi:outer membrane protein TolC
VNVNLPINKSRRCARVREVESRLRQHRAEYERLVDEISNELYANYERLLESRRTAQLYSERILPAARQNVESARAGYVAGKVDFLRLIEAQRQLIELREQQVETIADFHRRLAELERAAAAPLESASR